MNYQEIIAGIMVGAAAAYTLFRMVSLFIPVKQGDTKKGCGSGCSHCHPGFTDKADKKRLHLFIPPHFHVDKE